MRILSPLVRPTVIVVQHCSTVSDTEDITRRGSMGQTASTPMVGHKPRHHPSVSSFRGSIRSALLPRRAQTAQGSLSATFHCVDSDLKLNQLNINTATEEELMTLPGINRTVAQSIVEYRRQIGRFNKPEDLALVSGVGAEKLALIRPEICVRKRMTDRGSIGSSHASSMESLEPISMLPPSPSPSSARPAVDINTASVFELMTVRGLTQETAAAIVEYRTRRGPFRSVDALTKVKGFKSISTSPSTPNGFLTPEAIYEVLSPMCERPFISAVDSKGGVRVASWCLSPEFSAAKAGNLGVQEVTCRTILENRFDVIALQGACDELALKKVHVTIKLVANQEKVVSELNHPKLKRVLEWKSNNRAWKTSMPATNNKAGLAFLYNSQAVHLLSPPAEINLGPIADNILALPKGISAVLAEFKVKPTV
ncbi:hypothetical protein B566_EDAN000765 [Ephemera danica]|nr:hypothetical protein B566_EDAN000765 [Ephemera danica]